MARDFLKELIEIDTTDATGDNTAAAQAMADKLLAAGFPPEDVQVLGPVERKGNLVARYRGRDSGRKPLLFAPHGFWMSAGLHIAYNSLILAAR